jgi:dGTPase
VFVCDEGDHYRSRLTHSLEVGQIARGICRSLALEETLAETLALAHDLGHTPFGHAGEAALDAALGEFGGFDHNVQTLRIVTRLEARYAAFDGLNLTWETLEGLAKHNGPVASGTAPAPIAELDRDMDLRLDEWPGLEAQAAALADDIAYNNHDIDDGLRSGLLCLDDLRGLPLFGDAIDEVEASYGRLPPARLIHETVRRGVRAMVADAVEETRRRLAEAKPANADRVRRAGRATVAFSDGMAEIDRVLKVFMRERLFHHPHIKSETDRARMVVTDLFDALTTRPDALPAEWRERAGGANACRTARVVADYIAGMTDRFALREHARLCKGDSSSR